MKKKQIIGLGTLLLVCLLGLFTTSYANDITLNQFKNFVVNVGIKNNINETNMINYIDNSSAFSSFVNATTNVFGNPNIDLYILNTANNIWFYYFNYNTTNKIVVRNKNDVDITISGSFTGYQLQVSDSTLFRTTTSTTYNLTKNGYYYSDLNMYDGWGSTIWKTAPIYWTSSAIFEGPYQDALPFTFILKPAEEYADVYDFEDIPLYNASGEDLYIGQLFKPQTSVIEYWSVNNYYYRFGDWNFRDLPSRSFYMNYVGSDDSNDIYDVFLDKDFITENTIYSTIWADSSTVPYTLAIGNFYLKNNNTVVSNGVVDVSKTFSGDYKDKYDNNLDNQEDVNNIEQAITGTILDDSEVDNILGQFDSSGEIKEVFGYQDIGEEAEGFTVPRMYITYLMQEVLNTLVIVGDQPGNSYIDIPIDGEPDYRVYARYFHTPDGTLMIFVRNLLIFGGIYCLYKYFVEVAELLTTFNIHEAANKVDTDQFIFRM